MFTPRYSRPGAGMALLLALVAMAFGAPAAGAHVITSSSSGYEGGERGVGGAVARGVARCQTAWRTRWSGISGSSRGLQQARRAG
jgi:hypothetical protein